MRTGAIGAMLDVYETAIAELKDVVSGIRNDQLTVIIDEHTADANCRSLQTILTHVVHAAFGYATFIHGLKEQRERPGKVLHNAVEDYLHDIDRAFAYTEEVLNRFTDEETEQKDEHLKILTGWGQRYDIEQLMEHAIVHILRHKRQIEKIKAGLLL